MRRFLWMAVLLAGCGQQPTDPFIPPVPALGSGSAQVQWTVASPDCAHCATTISLDRQRSLRVVVIEAGQFSIHATEVKDVEWRTARDLVSPVASGGRRAGCVEDAPAETFRSFEGETGWSARVEGCDAPDIERARAHLRDLVQRYLPQVGI